MDYLILGGDARMPALAALLRAQGYTALHTARPMAEALAAAENIVVNCPPRCDLTMEALLAMTSPRARVWLCGPMGMEGPRMVDLWKDETLQVENAWLTAEGAVSAAMRNSGRCLRGMCCAVIGWGRIGRALTELLVALGARVTVISRSESHRHRAIERGAEAVAPERMGNALNAAGLVINTAPAMVLDKDALQHMARDAMAIDLASPPYGIDLRAAWARGIRAWREPGLPGRYCPESAAAALLRAIARGGDRRG